jgi:uncharacterized protein (DUF305 family)
MTGCTINFGSGMAGPHSDMMHGEASGFSSADLMFAQMMIPHHQQAVDMGTLAETRASDPAVKELAAKIKAEQAPEIAQMSAWLADANSSSGMDHNMAMGGMLSDSEMAALTDAEGAAFDKLFLTAMIEHHKGAIQMAQMIIDSNNAEAAALAKAITSSQTEQIAYMEELLAN